MYTILTIVGVLCLVYLGMAIAVYLRPPKCTPRYPDYTLEFIRGYVQELVHKHLMEAGIIVTRAREDAPLIQSTPDGIYARFRLDGEDAPYRIRLVDEQYVEPGCRSIIRELRRIECASVTLRVQVREQGGYPDVTIDIVPR